MAFKFQFLQSFYFQIVLDLLMSLLIFIRYLFNLYQRMHDATKNLFLIAQWNTTNRFYHFYSYSGYSTIMGERYMKMMPLPVFWSFTVVSVASQNFTTLFDSMVQQLFSLSPIQLSALLYASLVPSSTLSSLGSPQFVGWKPAFLWIIRFCGLSFMGDNWNKKKNKKNKLLKSFYGQYKIAD